MSGAQHTLGHIPPCPGCLAHEVVLKTEIGRDLLYAEAAAQWMQSRTFEGGKRSRYLREHSLRDLHDYHRPLLRFFGMLKLSQITWGNLKQYQFERSSGLLGPSAEDLLPVYVTRVARALRKPREYVEADPQAMALVRAQIDAHPEREVGPNKINQELGMLVRILKMAGLWTAEMEEGYEPLQHEESDIPRALTPEEQQRFLYHAQRLQPFIHQYAIAGIHCVFRTREERELQIGDINLGAAGVVLVRFRSSKNKFSIRTIPLSDEAKWAFERLLERANKLGSRSPQHYLMPFMVTREQYDPTRPMTVSGIKKPWDEVRIAAELPWFTPYHLRGTGLTRYAESGIAIHTMLSFAGHLSRRMQDHYVQISDQAKKIGIQRAWSLPTAAAGAISAAKPYRSPRGAQRSR
jgi:integrase